MSDPLLDVNLQMMEQAAAQVQQMLIEKLKDERGVHIEDAIAGAAALTGCLLLRSTGVPLEGEGMEPGSTVLVDQVNELGPRYMGFLSSICGAMGIDPTTGWTDPIPQDHQPLKPLAELVRILEGPFLALCDQLGVPEDYRARLALFTAARIIRAGSSGVLDPNIGKALALNSLVAGSKTVPHPLAA